MPFYKKTFFKGLILGLVLTSFLLLVIFVSLEHRVLAADINLPNANYVPTGMNAWQMVEKIIDYALGFLGLLAVVLILFAGFTWMTAAGNEDKVKKAKTILRNAIIGLLIILAAWAIVRLVFGIFGLGTSSGGCTAGECVSCNRRCDSNNTTTSYDITCSSLCSGRDILPGTEFVVKWVDPREDEIGVSLCRKIQAGFSHDLDPATVTKTNIEVKIPRSACILCEGKSAGESCRSNYACSSGLCQSGTCQGDTVAGNFTVLGKYFSFDPSNDFEKNVKYQVKIKTDVKNFGGDNLFREKVWTFMTGEEEDTIPPIVNRVYPADKETDVCLKSPLEAEFSEPMDVISLMNNDSLLVNPLVGGGFSHNIERAISLIADPNSPFSANTLYNSILNSEIITDSCGNYLDGNTNGTYEPSPPSTPRPLIDDYPWSFTTGTTAECTPEITSVVPSSGFYGDEVTVRGNYFTIAGALMFHNRVYAGYNCFDSEQYPNLPCLVDWSNHQIKVKVPSAGGASNGAISTGVWVEIGERMSEGKDFFVLSPHIDRISAEQGGRGQYVTINGSNFGAEQGTVYFVEELNHARKIEASYPCDVSWLDRQIIIKVPETIVLGSYYLQVKTPENKYSNIEDFVVNNEPPGPGLCALTPDCPDGNDGGVVGDIKTIKGEKFGSSRGTSKIFFGLQEADLVSSWSDNSITLTVPSGVKRGNNPVKVVVGGKDSNTLDFRSPCDLGDPCDLDPTTVPCEPSSCSGTAFCCSSSGTCGDSVCTCINRFCDNNLTNATCDPNRNLCNAGYYCDNSTCLCEQGTPCDNDLETLGCQPGTCAAGFYCDSSTCFCQPQQPCDGDTASGCQPDSTICPSGQTCNNLTCFCVNSVPPGSDCSDSRYTPCTLGGTCSDPYSCLVDNSATPGNCRCCCDPSLANSCPNPLDCRANQAPCTGGDRGLCCGCDRDIQCAEMENTGCGQDTCCHGRPEIVSVFPILNSVDVCLNTLATGEFNKKMDRGTLNSSNIKLFKDTDYTEISAYIEVMDGDKKFVLLPSRCRLALEPSTSYDLAFKISQDRRGILSNEGVSFLNCPAGARIWETETGDKYCLFKFTTGDETNFCPESYIKVDPETKTLVSGQGSEYHAIAYNDKGTVSDISDDAPICEASFNWSSQETSVATVNPAVGLITNVTARDIPVDPGRASTTIVAKGKDDITCDDGEAPGICGALTVIYGADLGDPCYNEITDAGRCSSENPDCHPTYRIGGEIRSMTCDYNQCRCALGSGIGEPCYWGAGSASCDISHSECLPSLECNPTTCRCQTDYPTMTIIPPSLKCTNGAVTFDFDQLMDHSTISIGRVDPADPTNILGNIIVKRGGVLIPGRLVVQDQDGPDADDEPDHTVVTFNSLNLLEAGESYTISLANPLPKNKFGLSLTSIYPPDSTTPIDSLTFTLLDSAEFCVINDLLVKPSVWNSRQRDEMMDFIAYPKDFSGGPLNIINIFFAWTEIDPKSVIELSAPITEQTITVSHPQNKNGQANLQASASGIGEYIGSAEAMAAIDIFICQNPWEFIDSDTHFRIRYCRDKGEAKYCAKYEGELFSTPSGEMEVNNPLANSSMRSCNNSTRICRVCRDSIEDDLPEIRPVSPGSTTSDILKDYLFSAESDGLAGAIGLRVFKNDEHYSPKKWFEKKFARTPSNTSLTVDNYSAIQEGRTVYIGAANKTYVPEVIARETTDLGYKSLIQTVKNQGGFIVKIIDYLLGWWKKISPLTKEAGASEDRGEQKIYTNVYLLSYSESAGDDAINIYNQILNNWEFSFGTDLSIEEKIYLARDTKRLGDLKDMADLLEKYKTINGHYPLLTAGTYISGESTSLWPSWKETLGPDLREILPLDPINKLFYPIKPDVTCSSNNDCTDSYYPQCYQNKCIGLERNYSPLTGWNELINRFKCPVGSSFYMYKVGEGGNNYSLYSKMEYAAEIGWMPADGLINSFIAPCTASPECAVNYAYTPSGGSPLVSCRTDSSCDGVCPAGCTTRDDPDCGCNSVSYDGICCQAANCNQYNDLDCQPRISTIEWVCNDEIDNDLDGQIDCADSDCQGVICEGECQVCQSGSCRPNNSFCFDSNYCSAHTCVVSPAPSHCSSQLRCGLSDPSQGLSCLVTTINETSSDYCRYCSHCADNVRNCGETGIDCGGDCPHNCCLSHNHLGCYLNDVYWFDSCANRQELNQDCSSGNCVDGACVLPTYTLTINALNGSVAKSPNQATYTYGATVTLTATANTGYTFTGWSNDLTGTTNPATLTINANKTVTANFDDLSAPTVLSLSVNPTHTCASSNVNITWTGNDLGGSGIDRVEVWQSIGTGLWTEISGCRRSFSTFTNSVSGSCVDQTLATGSGTVEYRYGIHIIDKANNCITETGAHCGGVTSDGGDLSRISRGPLSVQVAYCSSGEECVDGACRPICVNDNGVCRTECYEISSGKMINVRDNDCLKYVFVTGGTVSNSSMSGGITDGRIFFGTDVGRVAADRICQELASNSGLPGNYRAWLSGKIGTDVYSPATDASFIKSSSPYILTGGDNVIIANNWADLTDGLLNVSINKTENGITIASATKNVWTGTYKDGNRLERDCHDNWDNSSMSYSSGYLAGLGSSNTRSSATSSSSSPTVGWTDNYPAVFNCSEKKHLYCFRQ